MKHAKKMKLVDIDDDINHQLGDQQYLSHLSDDQFTSPRTLSMLDRSMNAILNRSDMNDGEKWTLYHQTLQRYLYHMRNIKNLPRQQANDNIQLNTEDQKNNTPEAFNFRISDHNISGIAPIKDSINNIAVPHVRQFFEKARQSDVNQLSPISRISSDDSLDFANLSQTPPHQQQPMSIPTTKNTTKRKPKRGTKRNASNNITAHQPRKVLAIEPKQLYRSRRPAQSNFDFYWKDSTAK